MNRTVVSGVAAFALMIGAGLAMTDTTAEAGRCGGGLFSRLQAKSCGGKVMENLGSKSCGGGLLARLKAKHASDCCAPEAAPEAAPVRQLLLARQHHAQLRLSAARSLACWSVCSANYVATSLVAMIHVRLPLLATLKTWKKLQAVATRARKLLHQHLWLMQRPTHSRV